MLDFLSEIDYLQDEVEELKLEKNGLEKEIANRGKELYEVN